jgi:hypothetical protein
LSTIDSSMILLQEGDLVTLNVHPSWIRGEIAPVLLVVRTDRTTDLGKTMCIVLSPDGTTQTFFRRHLIKLP